MNCKEVEKLIPLFVENQLDTEDLREFVDHIHNCKDCEEELTIQLLVTEGLHRLESGNAFNLQDEFKVHIADAEHTLKVRENMRWLLFGLEGLVVVLSLTILSLIFIW